MSTAKETKRKIFILGMDIMVSIKSNILELREIISTGAKVIEANPDDTSDIQEFYRQEIAKAHTAIAEKKKVAQNFFEQYRAEHPESIAIFEKEYQELPLN